MQLTWLGKDFNYSFKIALWKALRSALIAALAVFAASGTLDVFFDSLSTGLTPLIPAYLIPVVAALLSVVRNFVKQWVSGK